MAHHRCTRCKQESYPRHKHQGGVYCDDCMTWIRGGRYGRYRGRSWFGAIWDIITDFASSAFRHRSIQRVSMAEEKASYIRLKAIEARARSILYNPGDVVPQKR